MSVKEIQFFFLFSKSAWDYCNTHVALSLLIPGQRGKSWEKAYYSKPESKKMELDNLLLSFFVFILIKDAGKNEIPIFNLTQLSLALFIFSGKWSHLTLMVLNDANLWLQKKFLLLYLNSNLIQMYNEWLK